MSKKTEKTEPEFRPVKPVKGIRPMGSQVLIEQLTSQETNTSTIVTTGKSSDTPQGYILGLGPMVPEMYGLKVGDRVFFSSPYAVLPPVKKTGDRDRWCIEYTSIKGVLEE